jgi:hypothetical protein
MEWNINLNNLDDIRTTVLNVIKTMDNSMKELSQTIRSRNSLEIGLKDVENSIMVEISANKEMFPNDLSRKSELARRLKNNSDYQTKLNQQIDVEIRLKELENTISLCKYSLQAFDIIRR